MESVERTTDGSEDPSDNSKLGMEEETLTNSNQNEQEALNQEADGQVVNGSRSYKRWSELLQSPRGTECFSPSLDPSKPDSLHGIGKLLHQRHSTLFLSDVVMLIIFFIVSNRDETRLIQIQIYWRSCTQDASFPR